MKRRIERPRFLQRTIERWQAEDYPGGPKHFHPAALMKDFMVFIGLPVAAAVVLRIVTGSSPQHANLARREVTTGTSEKNDLQPQIIRFAGGTDRRPSSPARRSPGTLVRTRLLNVVETLAVAPVQAQVLDDSLGPSFRGAILLGDATAETDIGKVSITFHFLRDPIHPSAAFPISARALSLNGTYGLEATKKEGFFARSSLNTMTDTTQAGEPARDPSDLKSLIAKFVAGGIVKELQGDVSAAATRAQILTLQPSTEFLVELTDFFPAAK